MKTFKIYYRSEGRTTNTLIVGYDRDEAILNFYTRHPGHSIDLVHDVTRLLFPPVNTYLNSKGEYYGQAK